jgi:hypothetical protein
MADIAPQSTPAPNKGAAAVIKLLFLLLAFGYGAYMFFGGGVEDKVATDAIDQYNLVSRSGSSMDKCVHAGLVAAAFVQAKDQDNFKKWKSVEQMDCAIAGVPAP